MNTEQSRDSTQSRLPLWLRRLHAWVERHAPALLTAMIGLWGAIFALAAVYKLQAMWMGFDLGTHEQVLWNTIHGRIAASSPSPCSAELCARQPELVQSKARSAATTGRMVRGYR